MTFQFAPEALVGFLLALVRTSAWLVVVPPFNTRMVPVQVKVGLATAISLAVGPQVAETTTVPLEVLPLIAAIAVNVATGLALGFLAQILFGAVQAAGALIDMFSGFSMATIYDPFSNAASSIFGRFYQLLAITLLFAINGHLLLVRGFMTSFSAVPLEGPDFGNLSELVAKGVSTFFIAAVEIAGPLLAALFLAEVVMGLLSRAAPQMNIFAVGFTAKILLVLGLAGLAIPLLPEAVTGLVEQMVQGGGDAAGAFGG